MQSFEKWLVNSRLWNFYNSHLHLARMFALAERNVGPLVLELGCGSGYTTQEILKRFPEVEVTAIDYDLDQVTTARERLAPFGERVSVQQGDATVLSLPSATFDTVFEFNVFHHIRDYEKAMQEVRRVLKPGGSFYAIDISQSFF